MKFKSMFSIWVAFLLSVALTNAQSQQVAFRPGGVIVKFKSDVSTASIDSVLSNAGIQIAREFSDISVYKCTISGGKAVHTAVAECNADPNIEYAEPNYIYRTFKTPDDPRFSDLWNLTIISAPEAWDLQTGDRTNIVGVIDTGVDLDHEDLEANIWINPGESGDGKESNGIDDDGNGFIDDYRGWDFINDDNNPNDDNDHGTHVSGTLGAVGDNGIGIVGVNWEVSIMALKFLGADGSGSLDDAIGAILYATNNGAKVLSNSWGSEERSQALEDAIQFANDNGVLFVAAAGNGGADGVGDNNDSFPSYPANYEVPNVISVAASTSSDDLPRFSNFGKNSVDLAAPGADILSTVRNNRYERFSGTSMATPHVSGAAALIWAQYPGINSNQVKIRLLGSVDRKPAYTGEVATGGRLNVHKALSTNPIIFTRRLDNTENETGPYVVNADITDDTSISSAQLTYQVSGGTSATNAMILVGNGLYRAEIPGQPKGTTITYFVKAADSDGNETRDSNFTFEVREAGGCGADGAAEITSIQNPALRTTVNATLNIIFFLLPLYLIKSRSGRRKA